MLLPFRLILLHSLIIICVEGQRRGRQLDVAVLTYDPPAIRTPESEKQWSIIRYLDQKFVISETQTRIAVVHHSATPTILLNLTANAKDVEQFQGVALQNSKKTEESPGVPSSKNAPAGLELIRDVVFRNARSTAKKTILMFYFGFKDPGPLISTAKQLRENGIDIFVIGFWTDEHERMHEITNITGGRKERESNWARYYEMLDGMAEYYMCHEEICRYEDEKRQKCIPDWFGDQCELDEPPKSSLERKCEQKHCEMLCDEIRPAVRTKCSTGECGNITVNRAKNANKESYQHVGTLCSPTATIVCPNLCPSGKGPGGNGPATNVPGGGGPGDGEKADNGLPTWAIPFVVLIMLLLAFILVFIVIVHRKRRRAAKLLLLKGLKSKVGLPTPAGVSSGIGGKGRGGTDQSMDASLLSGLDVKGGKAGQAKYASAAIGGKGRGGAERSIEAYACTQVAKGVLPPSPRSDKARPTYQQGDVGVDVGVCGAKIKRERLITALINADVGVGRQVTSENDTENDTAASFGSRSGQSAPALTADTCAVRITFLIKDYGQDCLQ